MVQHAVCLRLCRLHWCIHCPDLEVERTFLQDDALHLLLIMNVGTIGFLPPAAGLCGFSPYGFVVLSATEVVSRL